MRASCGRKSSVMYNLSASKCGSAFQFPYATSFYLVVVIGLALRLWLLLMNHSLWLDESSLALSILAGSFVELLFPLANGQAAPVGFLWLAKAVTVIAGSSEVSLRLVPFLAGSGAVLVFAAICRLT